MEYKENSFIWDEEFPPVYGHTSLSFLLSRPGFNSAKSGDMDAASAVVGMCVKKNILHELKQRYPAAILLPVTGSNNRLPEALARSIGLEIDKELIQRKPVDRKALSAMERMLCTPTFEGSIRKGNEYIIVDDVITQGGTISALRKFVINNGGSVAAISSLTYSIGSRAVAPNPQDFYELALKFNYAMLTRLLKEYHIANDPRELTKQQIRYLLRFDKLGQIDIKMKAVSAALIQKSAKIKTT